MSADRSNKRTKLLTGLLGHILQQGASVGDLKQISSDLRDGALPWKLAELIDDVATRLSGSDISSPTTMNDVIEGILEFVQKKRLSKAKFLDIASATLRKSAIAYVDPGEPMREIVNRLVLGLTEDDALRLLEAIESSGKGDPYLRGIMARKNNAR